ncbi:PqiC family protein [Oceaniglobus trochenteri]|uniref:PqiC family protein n=1 Tax=Oceaniglobus trochenteri TaxID=2763260 RepID=UPI001D0016EF|nr:ABC-type transport auxiliary lipoprotein family protein [Oceaniglobus trochenteri]
MKILPLAALALVALGACANTPTLRYAVPSVTADEKIAVRVGTVEVREVNLPLYASLETITLEGVNGELLTDKNLLWADDPTRGMTQGLADALSTLTRAKVAAEPWPLSDTPDARLEVRFSKALAQADGNYRIAGQYFVSFPTGARRDVAGRFDIAVPYVAGNARAIAAAQGQAITGLARTIAQNGL